MVCACSGQAITTGFEEQVGNKTTMRLVNRKWAAAYKVSRKTMRSLAVYVADSQPHLTVSRSTRDPCGVHHLGTEHHCFSLHVSLQN